MAVIRIALPANSSLPPLIDWPKDLIAAVGENTYMVHGGYEFDGSEITPLDEAEILETARDIKRKGIAHVAISCVFSPINDQMERRAAALVRQVIPGVNITLSSEIGRLSLIERENATVMNAALASLSRRVVGSFRHALGSLQIRAPFLPGNGSDTFRSAEIVPCMDGLPREIVKIGCDGKFAAVFRNYLIRNGPKRTHLRMARSQMSDSTRSFRGAFSS